MLIADCLTYRLPDGRVLFENLSACIEPGSCVAIQGPSGTGKTTLLSILGGLLAPTSGFVSTVTDPSRQYAWVLQSLNVLGARSVLANSLLLAHLDGTRGSRVELRAREALDDFGLGGLVDVRARKLSGGELQRLGVARALISTRPIILADEPTNQLDRENAKLVMDRLVSSAEVDGRTVVIVTHDRRALPPTCAVLDLGPLGLELAKSESQDQ